MEVVTVCFYNGWKESAMLSDFFERGYFTAKSDVKM